MSKHTVTMLGGRRVVVQRSKTTRDAIQLELLGADRVSVSVCTIAVADIGMLMLALEAVAQCVERDVADRDAGRALRVDAGGVSAVEGVR